MLTARAVVVAAAERPPPTSGDPKALLAADTEAAGGIGNPAKLRGGTE
jgi:hypothetical protein